MALPQFVAPLIVSLAVIVGQEAHADQFGCTVLLCVSNPAGPRAAGGDCPPAIDKLYRDLRRGKPFPTCEQAGDRASRTGYYAMMVMKQYPDCPSGMTPVAGLVMQAGDRRAWRSEGGRTDDSGLPGPRACVGNLVGQAPIIKGDGDTSFVNVYDRVVSQEPIIRHVDLEMYKDGKPFEGMQ